MVYLDLKKKVWRVKDLEIPVIENVPMKELQWFKDNLNKTQKELTANKLTDADIVTFEDEWDKKVCEIGLHTDYDTIINTGISNPEFRELIAEVFTFLKAIGTVEKAEQSGLYDQKTPSKEEKP